MDNSRWHTQRPFLRLFECLLALYPPRFRGEFSAEIRAILVSRMREVEERGMLVWLVVAFQEIKGLIISILGECWHELWARKEKVMITEDQLSKDAGAEGGGMAALRPAGTPGVLWFIGWTLLTTAVIPAVWITWVPLTATLVWLIDQGVSAGLWTGPDQSALEGLGILISLALALSSAQWVPLRKFLPRAWLWFIATGTGFFLGGLAIGLALWRPSVQNWDPIWIMAAVLLPVGLTLGLAQWLYLRHFLPNAFWIIFIDVLAAGSILLVGPSINNLTELMVLTLPGLITGAGLWLLLSQPRRIMQPYTQTPVIRGNSRRFPRFALIGIGVLGLIPLFFACSWVFAVSQLEMAKREGVYPTVEEAVIGLHSQGWGGANVVSIQDVETGPNRSDGAQPHVWYGVARVYLDRVPAGYNKTSYSSGGYYLHVQEGWVRVSEGAFPEFIGWMMELYNLEGVH